MLSDQDKIKWGKYLKNISIVTQNSEEG
jgi:hypothetical protein